MPAPTIITYTEPTPLNWNYIDNPKSSPSIDWLAGDIIVVLALGQFTNLDFGFQTPTATGLTFTVHQNTRLDGTYCGAMIASASPTASGSSAVTVANTSGSRFGFAVWVFRGSGGIGNSVEQHTATMTINLTPISAHSAIVWGVGDRGAAALQTITPTPSNTRLSTVFTSYYTGYVSDLADQSSTEATLYGISGTGSGAFSIVALEIKAGSDASPIQEFVANG